MNEEERLTLNNYIEDLYQAMQIGDIVFEPKHSSELYNLINKLLQENQKLKEQLQQKEAKEKELTNYLKEKIKERDKDIELLGQDCYMSKYAYKEILSKIEKRDEQ